MRSLPQWYRDEREKLKDYGWQDRLRYIWQYYRLWIIGIGFVAGFLVYAVWNYVTVPGDIHFYGIFSNTYAQLGKGTAFYDGFVEAAGYDLSTGVVEIDSANYCKPSGRAVGNVYYEKLISMLDGGVDDVWVAPEEDVIAVGEGGRLLDLSGEAAAPLRERYADRFVYCTPLDAAYSDRPVPVGIDLSGTWLVGEYRAYPDGAVLGVNAATKRLDQVLVFLDYLFACEG